MSVSLSLQCLNTVIDRSCFTNVLIASTVQRLRWRSGWRTSKWPLNWRTNATDPRLRSCPVVSLTTVSHRHFLHVNFCSTDFTDLTQATQILMLTRKSMTCKNMFQLNSVLILLITDTCFDVFLSNAMMQMFMCVASVFKHSLWSLYTVLTEQLKQFSLFSVDHVSQVSSPPVLHVNLLHTHTHTCSFTSALLN